MAFTPSSSEQGEELEQTPEEVPDLALTDENAAGSGLNSGSGGGVNGLLLLLVPVALLGGLFIGLRLRNK